MISSVQRLMGTVLMLMLGPLLSACGGGAPSLAPVSTATSNNSAGVRSLPIHFMTTRKPTSGGQLFGPERAQQPSFGRIEVGIPPGHRIGRLELARNRPDPQRHFHVQRFTSMNNRAFYDAITQQQPLHTVVYVHGFNNTFGESLFQMAQIVHDVGRQVFPIHLSWASRGSLNGYLYDRDSALAARDDLRQLLIWLSRNPSSTISLVAHSMGSLIVSETLAELTTAGALSTLGKIDRVLMISPDIDQNLFEDQLRRSAYPTNRMIIAMNSKDRALALSGRLAGVRQRIGRDLSPQRLRALGVNVLDASSVTDGGRNSHFLLASSPTLLAFVRTLGDEEAANVQGP